MCQLEGKFKQIISEKIIKITDILAKHAENMQDLNRKNYKNNSRFKRIEAIFIHSTWVINIDFGTSADMDWEKLGAEEEDDVLRVISPETL